MIQEYLKIQMNYSLIVNDVFLNQLLGLPQSVSKQVSRKLKLLQKDPNSAEGDAKQLLGNNQDNLYRVRIGDYRLIYTFRSNWVKCLAIGHRRDIYQKLNITIPNDEPIDYDDKPIENRGLLTEEILNNCFIPEEYRKPLLDVKSEEELLYLDIPEIIIQKILDILYPPSLEKIEQQPEKILTNPDDIELLFSGNIIGLLLKLDEEQERIYNYKIGSPVLLKGGPGTGKTILAVYRIKTLIENNCRSILFTAHSNSLINYSKNLLAQLLKDKIKYVETYTVDYLIRNYYLRKFQERPIPNHQQYLEYLQQAFIIVKDNHNFTGKQRLDWYASADKINKLGYDYLLREILQIIEGCGLLTEADYLDFDTTTSLNKKDKKFIWTVYQQLKIILDEQGYSTPEEYRIKALEYAKNDPEIKKYDALIVDETQDLSPVSLEFILSTVTSKKNIFITADSSQSIYKRGFDWRYVHKLLKGYILPLNYNYRNTEQIVTACRSVLNLEDKYQPSLRKGEIPTVYFCENKTEEIEKIRRFFLDSAKNYRIPLTGAAVISPNQTLAQEYASRLNDIGLPAQYLEGANIDLKSPFIKVITMEACKGLEFAFVAVVGIQAGFFPYKDNNLTKKELEMSIDQQERLFYVACSRAMQNLAVFASLTQRSSLTERLREPYWRREGGHE